MGALINVHRYGPYFSRGAERLAEAMVRGGYSQESLREKLGISQGTIGRWLRGERLPDGESRGKIFALLGIAPQSWDEKVAPPLATGTG